ncbi:unnamed protein product [Caenorhabditis angaria]|uniref:Peroxin-19 n=1 Tax=Caenorhabditis angaria TaxID=860376 RepID=A0A9P1IHL9_9PELO|nr:unnamed protein product [Caenorhabditis angaria]
MSGEEAKKSEADELSELLDSTLKNFDETKVVPKSTDDELDELMDLQDQKAAQKAAGDFQKMLEQMVQVQEEAMKRAAENPGGEAGNLNLGEGLEGLDPNDPESKAMMDAIKQLMECSSTVANANSAEEFMAGLEMLRSPESPMEPFMSMIMQTLASKEVMYPPLKEIFDNYPKYLEENSKDLDEETLTRYNKQFEVLGKICTEFENQPEFPTPSEPENAAITPDSAENSENPGNAVDLAAGEHFEKLGKLLVELQTYGYPPKELVGNLPDGWAIDESGLPKVNDAAAAADACTIM